MHSRHNIFYPRKPKLEREPSKFLKNKFSILQVQIHREEKSTKGTPKYLSFICTLLHEGTLATYATPWTCAIEERGNLDDEKWNVTTHIDIKIIVY